MQQYVHNGTKTAMSKDTGILQSYILGHNFTKNTAGKSVRPPTIGEENDVVSIDGKSSHSSVSEKSEVSTATPRRTDVDLGYEPEGSASPLPPYEKWKRSMYSMLHDSEGFLAFKNFLYGINQETVLECWLAMKGFRDFDRPRSSGNSSAASSTTGSLSNFQPSEERCAQKLKLAKRIYKTYLASNSQKSIGSIKLATKQYIMRQIKAAVEKSRSSEIDSHLFVQAQTEIEHNVEATLYKSFLASDEFTKLSTQQDGSTPKMSSGLHQQANLSQSPKNFEAASEPSEAPITGSQIPYLPRLDENRVWNPSRKKRESLNPSASTSGISHIDSASPSVSSSTRSGTSLYSTISQNNEISDAFPYFTEGAPPYWVPPASAIGSDQASKSSDATSDTLSFTDNSSVDGVTYSASRKGQKRLMRNHIKKNPTNALPDCHHVQRTSRMKDIPNLATKDPDAFFKLLEERLLEVMEEQSTKQKRVGAQFRARRSPPPPDPIVSMKNEDEDLDQMLESHLNRVIESPGGRHSPIMKNRRHLQPLPGSLRATNNPVNHSRIGVVPGMAQNEVPDVPTGVIPVNKTQMISAWIQMPATQQLRMKKKNRAAVPVVEAPSNGHFLHSAESTGLQSNYSTRKMQLLLQDTNMPLIDQPDALTTIEEVKRRLMEETDDSCDYSAFNALNIAADPRSAPVIPATSSNLLTCSKSQPVTVPDRVAQDQVTDSDSSSETATLSNVNPSGEVAQAKGEPDSTVVVYKMLHETVPYKVTINHNPLTLGQFKHAISRKGSYRYFFRQYSEELKRHVYFEVSNDSEILPRFEGYVLAKVDLVSA